MEWFRRLQVAVIAAVSALWAVAVVLTLIYPDRSVPGTLISSFAAVVVFLLGDKYLFKRLTRARNDTAANAPADAGPGDSDDARGP